MIETSRSEKPGMQLNALLRQVSRSFYLSIRILPPPVRPQIALAYLLARAADTIADTGLVAVDLRRKALARMREAISAAAVCAPVPDLGLGDLSAALEGPVGRGTEAEKYLLGRTPELLVALREQDQGDRARICGVLETITSGQDRDLARFGSLRRGEIVALETNYDLDDYTYHVAGCVGEFWTRMCRAKVFPHHTVDEQRLFRDAVDYGRGLQLVNILRDIPGDLRQGRCYLPRVELARSGVEPADLLEPSAIVRARRVLDSYLDRAAAGLAAGWRYAQALPPGCARVRLASAWPALIGARTLALLWSRNLLDPASRLKVGRREVQGLVVLSILIYPFKERWKGLFERAAGTGQ